MKRKGLGMGISALIEDFSANTEGNILLMDIDKVFPNKRQPRKDFREEALADLVSSIKAKGIIQPILVQRIADSYQIIAGERRWRAAREVKLDKVPIVIKDVSDVEAYELALIENIQREDLNPVEEAQGYKELIDEFELTQEELSRRLGKSRPTIANSLRLLTLPEEIVEHLRDGKLSAGHAKVLLSLKSVDDQIRLAEKVLSDSLSVVSTNKATKKINSAKKKKNVKESKDIFIADVEENLREFLSANVQIHKKKKGGIVMINYSTDEHLSSIVEKILGSSENGRKNS